jgi:uncharacterized protein
LKASQFNYFARPEDKLTHSAGKRLGFNTLSRKSVTFDGENLALAQQILTAPDSLLWLAHPLRQKLCELGFLVEDDLDELALIRVKDRLARFNTDHLDLALNLTHGCNFRCVYCYKPPRPETMSQEVADCVLRFVERHSKTINSLSIRWYGGEPLIQFPLLQKMGKQFREIAAKREIRFFSGLLTNGYLLTPDKAAFLTNELGIGYIVIPLDGPPEVHNARRPLAGGQGTFERILENICEAAQLDPRPPITVRINLDATNLNSAINVIEILDRAGLAGKISVAYGQIAGLTQACASAVDGMCIPRAKFIGSVGPYGAESIRRGFRIPQLQDLMKPGRCIAVCTNSYVVAPNGDLYKCDNETGLPGLRVGYFDQEGKAHFETNLVKWLAFDITEREECRCCPLLPICMGGCAYRWMKGTDRESDDDGQCAEWERSILKLRVFYQTAAMEPSANE